MTVSVHWIPFTKWIFTTFNILTHYLNKVWRKHVEFFHCMFVYNVDNFVKNCLSCMFYSWFLTCLCETYCWKRYLCNFKRPLAYL